MTSQVLDGDTVLGTGTLSGGTATVTIPGTALEVGSHTLTVRYLGDAQNAPSTTTVELDVAKAAATVSATAARFVYGRAGTVKVSVDPTLATGAVRVLEGENAPRGVRPSPTVPPRSPSRPGRSSRARTTSPSCTPVTSTCARRPPRSRSRWARRRRR